jgi:glycosyltransferase involved in cell wall biosynthesis
VSDARVADRLRCTVVTAYGTLGGSEYWLLDLLDHSPGTDPEVVLLQDGPVRHELDVRDVPTEVLPTGTAATSIAGSAWRLAGHLRRRAPDVVLATGVKAAAVAVPAARLAGVPVVWAKHDFSWDRRLARPLGALADGVVANSEAVAAATGRRDAVVVPPPRPLGVEPSRLAASAQWQRLGHALPTSPSLAMVGRLVSYKGIDTAIRALAETSTAWSLVVVGPADPAQPYERERLAELAVDLGLSDRVHLVPATPHAGRWLATFDAVAVLTRQEAGGFGREGYSMVALEALAAGVPLIGAAGSPEVVRMARHAGIVVAPDDPTAVARALVELGDARRRAELGARGRELMSRHPEVTATTASVNAVLARLAVRRRGQAA